METAATHRLFVALLPSEPARAALSGLAERMPRARWTPEHQIHLTLRFIGSVSADELQRVEDALAAVRVSPFPLGVEGVGRFPARGHPAVLWAGVGPAHPFLFRLRQQVDDRLLASGVSFELRPFVPHFTLARGRDWPVVAVEHWLKRHREFAGPVWRADAFQLMESHARPGGAEHRVVRRYALEDAAAPRPAPAA